MVKNHEIRRGIDLQGINVADNGLLRLTQVANNCTRCGNRRLTLIRAKSFQALNVQLLKHKCPA